MPLPRFSSPFKRRPGRHGVVTLELILWLPIMIIFLLAIVEFALIMQFNQQVAYAARFGAKLASEVSRLDASSPNLSDYVTGGDLKNEIDVYLANHGISASCEVKLEHNACVPDPTPTVQQDPAISVCKCGASATTLPAGENTTAGEGEAYVKVTVCVRLSGNVPNVLSTFGFDLNGIDGTAGNTDDPTIEHSTVFRIETANTQPTALVRAASVEGALPSGVTISPGLPDTADQAVTANDSTPNGATFELNFDATQVSDPEEGNPFTPTQYIWTITNGTITDGGGTNDATVRVRFTVPGAIADPAPSVASPTPRVDLSVRDSCNRASATDSLNVSITRQNP